MNITDSTVINVLNCSDSIVTVSSNIRPEGYLFEPSRDEQPFVIPLSFSEIRVINSQSAIFREGKLYFDKEYEKDVYEKLGIYDWENILSDAQIRDIILNPTKQKLEKIIKIYNLSMFDRIRGMLVMMQNTGMYDISTRVVNVINYRYQELYRGKKNTEIVINETKQDSKEDIIASELAKIKEEFEKQKQEMMKQIRAELEAEYKNKEVVKDEESETKKDTKKPGRPSSK